MKHIFFTITALLCAATIKAQIGIDRQNVSNNSVLLEFGLQSKGIILPSLDVIQNNSNGTFIINAAARVVQVLENNQWTNLSNIGELINQPNRITGRDNGAGVIMGAATSAKNGILVLESTTKAMVLPKVANPHTVLRSPVAGTMLYDTVSSSLAIYDGVNWNYWK